MLRELKNPWLAFALFMMLVLIILLWNTRISVAHDHSRPDLTPWFESLRAKNGAPCCDGKDGTSLDDPDWSMDNGHYRVRLDGKWYEVPDSALVEGTNKAGHAVVWTYRQWMGGEEGYAIRCFMAGTMT